MRVMNIRGYEGMNIRGYEVLFINIRGCNDTLVISILLYYKRVDVSSTVQILNYLLQEGSTRGLLIYFKLYRKAQREDMRAIHY